MVDMLSTVTHSIDPKLKRKHQKLANRWRGQRGRSSSPSSDDASRASPKSIDKIKISETNDETHSRLSINFFPTIRTNLKIDAATDNKPSHEKSQSTDLLNSQSFYDLNMAKIQQQERP